MLAAKGILTSEGGATSHAAVVARQFGVPCVVGATMVRIDLEKRQMEANGVVVKKASGSLLMARPARFSGTDSHTAPKLEEQTDLLTLLLWADDICATPGSEIFIHIAAFRYGLTPITPLTLAALARMAR